LELLSMNPISRQPPLADIPAATPSATPATMPAAPAPAIAADQLAINAAPAAAPAASFSTGRALGHFFRGFGQQGRDMVMGIVRHPLQAGLVIGAGALAVAAAPLVGISVATAGLALAGIFGAIGAFRIGQGAVAATVALRAGRFAEAEQDFEQVGRGTFDVATAVAPAAIAKGVSVLRGARGAAVAGEVAAEVAKAPRPNVTPAPGAGLPPCRPPQRPPRPNSPSPSPCLRRRPRRPSRRPWS